MPSHPNPTPEHLSIIILSAIKTHQKQLGVGSLALILKGSKSKLLQNRKLDESRFFGAFFYYPIKVIEHFIKQLIKKKMIEVVMVTGNPYPLPLLKLTLDGERTLEQKIDVILHVKREIKPVTLNESMNETFHIFCRLKDVSKTAGERNLAQSTIWAHLVSLIKLGQLLACEVVEEEKIKLVLEKRNALNTLRLKELKDALPENISYEEIKCVLAGEEDNSVSNNSEAA